MKKIIFDSKKLQYSNRKVGFTDVLLAFLKYLGISLLMFLGCYALFSVIFNTDHEQMLRSENAELAKQYEDLREKMDLVESVIDNLEVRDRTIYNDVFSTDPPRFSIADLDTTKLDIGSLHEMSEEDLVWDTYALAHRMEINTYQVENWIRNIEYHLSARKSPATAIPSIIPIRNFSVVQTGASIGEKFNPFYKALKEHNGIDLMAPVGTDVLCAADGVVTSVSRSLRGMGNRVVVSHADSIVTSYSHLSDILVREGQPVKQGSLIGRVGSSGTCFAPCLHYEIIRDGECQNPVNFFYAELAPESFREMMMIAQTTGQSMD